MTDREVKVSLSAQVAGYILGMEKAAAATRGTRSEVQKLAAQSQSFEMLGRSALLFGAVAAAGIAIAINKFAEFDQAMSNVQAATQETAANMELLRAAALDAGAKTVFSATEAANAIEELGKNGLTTKEILEGGLAGALSLATAGQLEVGRAAEIASISMKQFSLTGKDVPHITDLLAAGAGKAAGDVEDMAQALAQSGLVAHQYGLTIEETTGLLAAFADKGLIGSDAGTSLKTMLQSLTPSSNQAREALDSLGVSAYDGAGKFVGIAKFAGLYSDAMNKLTPEVQASTSKIIFGSDAVRASNVLYDLGAKGIQKYIDQTNDSGYAAKVAADRLDNLRGDVEKLSGSLDTALIESGSGANDQLRILTQTATFLVDSFGDLPQPVIEGALALGTLLTATTLVAGGFLTLAPKIAATKVAMGEIGTGALVGKIVSLGSALGVAGIVVGVFTAAIADQRAKIDALKGSLDQTTGATTKYTREIIASQLQSSGAADAAASIGVSLNTLTDAALGVPSALKAVRQAYSDSDAAGNTTLALMDQIGTAFGRVGTTQLESNLQSLSGNLGDSADELRDVKAASIEAGDGYQEAADKAAALQSQLDSLIETINKANGVGQDAVSTNASYQDALQGVKDTIADIDPETGNAREGAAALNRTIDETTAAGAKNADMFANLASKSQDAAKAQLDLDGNTDTYLANLDAGRQTLYDQIVALTGNADAAQALTDKIYAIPTDAEVKILVDTANAQSAIDDFIAQNYGRQIGVGMYANKPLPNENGGMYNRGVRAFENGGFPSGTYAGRPGGIHKFAEEKLPWETYISPKPGHERENIGYALDSLNRLGYQPSSASEKAAPVNFGDTKITTISTDPNETAALIDARNKWRFGGQR